ncbi:F-box domain-containing protein [Mycena chlorophos]|uniref:F-box domain-containing protein n=1 Tax=Mycena chlorophos TaxID=658473 RepID=A0A8H6VUD2_MYCCL|nr:F-box domain-containing protein [Mycena chlorophos]
MCTPRPSALMSPKQKPFHLPALPVEILSEIFILCLPEIPTSCELTPEFDPERPDAPWLFMQICKAWRGIALATPRLWQRLWVNFDPDSEVTNVFESFVARSGALPLELAVWGIEPTPPEFDDFVDSLQINAAKIGSLKLEMMPHNAAVLNAASFSFPRLREVDMNLQYDSWDWEALAPVTLFRDAPSLRSVTLRRSLPWLVELPWQQLTKLVLDALHLENCVEALRLAPNVTHVEIELNLIPLLPRPRPPPLTHHHIHYLHLLEWEEEPVSIHDADLFLLEFLTLPALEILELGCTGRMAPSILDDFLRRSSPPLQKLQFGRYSLNLELALWTTMEPFVGLRLAVLELESPPRTFSEPFFAALGSDIAFLPILHTLTIGFEPHGYFSIHEARLEYLMAVAGNALTKRRRLRALANDPCSLRSLRFLSRDAWSHVPSLELESLEILRTLKRDGLEVYIGIHNTHVMNSLHQYTEDGVSLLEIE